ncbi:MAG TPA: hypothetical protein EYN66_14165, partial [Myxococcales bacterium]|nr:hypothetical protein [Myxococcales bacterium]
PSFVPADEVALLNKAEKQIAEIRQGDLIVSVENAWGQPAEKVQVSWTQVDRDFRFGVDTPFEPTVWADLVRIGVNHSVAELDWRNTQPRIGDIRLEEHVKAWGLNVFPGKRNSTSAAGMVWLKKDRMPDWVNGLTPTEKAGAIDWHVTRLAEELRGRVSVWEVLREPTALHAGALEDNGDLLKMARSATSAIRESDPVSAIMVSFKNPLGEHQEITPLAFSKRIKDAGLEFDIIGLQYMYNGVEPWTWRSSLSDLSSLARRFRLVPTLIELFQSLLISRIEKDFTGCQRKGVCAIAPLFANLMNRVVATT